MSDRIRIPIEADGGDAVRAFRGVGAASQRMGQEVTRSAQDAERGLAGFSRSAKNVGDALDEVGTAVGALVAGMAILGRNSRDAERQVDGLRRAYGDQADEVLAATEAIQDHTNFSNDAARQAALTGIALVQNYGLAADQIEDLIGVSADLATIHGIELPDAMSRVAGAIRGEGEAAELLGLNMSDAAVAAAAAAQGLDGWTTSMTESEKAAFRFTLLMDQAAFSTGAAGDAAQGAAGRAQDFVHWLDDTAEAAGGMLGPVGESLAVMGNVALAAPLAGNALGRMAQGLSRVGESAAAARLGSAALNLALGPAGLVAAAGAAGFAIYQLAQRADDYNLSAGESEQITNDVIAALSRLEQSGASGTVLAGVREGVEFMFDLRDAAAAAEPVLAAVNDRIAEQVERINDLINVGTTGEELDAEYERLAALEATRDTLEGAILTEEQYREAIEDTQAILSASSNVNYPELVRGVQSLQQQYQDGTITADEYAAGLDRIADNIDSYGLTLDDVAPAQETFAIGMRTGTDAALQLGGAVEGVLTPAVGNAASGMADLGGETDSLGESIGATDRTLGDYLESLEATIGRLPIFNALTREAVELTDEQRELIARNTEGVEANRAAAEQHRQATQQQVEAQREQAEATREQAEAGFSLLGFFDRLGAAATQAYRDAGSAAVDFLFTQENIVRTLDELEFDVGGGGRALNLAQGINDAATALENVTRIAIDNTGAWANLTQEVADFATALTVTTVNADGTIDALAAADDLLNRGLIDWRDYNAAQAATGEIVADNARAQDAWAEVQVKQLPLLQDQVDAVADYAEHLAGLPAAEAQRALALADTTYQTQIAELAALEYRVALGEIPAELATDIIADAARADPVLADVLETYGIIERDVHGNIVVEFEGGRTLVDTVTDLDESIDELTEAIRVLAGEPVDVRTTEATRETVALLERMRDLASGGDFLARMSLAAGAGLPTAPANQPPPPQDLLVEGPFVGGGTAVIDADYSQLQAAVDAAEEYVQRVTGPEWIAGLFADASALLNDAEDAEAELRRVADGDYEAALLADPSDALGDIGLVGSELANLDGNVATVRAVADIAGARNDINSLLGYQGDAQIVVNAVAGLLPNALFAHGGVVPHFAHGGVVPDAAPVPRAQDGRVVLVGEAGPELAYLPGGTFVSPAPATRGALGDGFGGVTVNLIVQGNVVGMDDLERHVMRAFAAAASVGVPLRRIELGMR